MHWQIRIPLRAVSSIRNTNWSLAFVALAALCWGLSGGIAGILTGEGWDPVVVSFYRGGTGLLFVLIWLALKPHHSGLANPRLWFWSVLAGVGVTGNFTFYFISIAEGSVAVAATLMYCAPVFVYIVSFLFRLEKPTVPKCIAMVLVMAGVVLLTGIYDLENTDVTLIAAGAGLLSGMSYALFIFGFKYAAPHGSPQAILLIAFAILAVLLIGLSGTTETLEVLSAPRLPLFLALGLLGGGISFILYIRGLNYTAPALAAIVAMIEPVTASLFGVVFLAQSLAAPQLLGMALILLTVTALGVYSSKA
ncbi:EamA family transporter [Aliidiomarina sedimenti]|uniref:EamA family transporter n=1 Tax=Aliidiomarina sedimenti TaxID=1933879 RepID=A0ABY0BYJ2_9GAMM|nr:EamA family transporter [Aliidiomarina sedimenti]RUO29746.1 EamA family transporter [Aliidiomarina sedimenti]